MQDRYTGDIGDFGKLGLLRQLQTAGFSIGVNWYHTPNETHNSDGLHINYLQDKKFYTCDPALWSALGCIVRSGTRKIAALEQVKLLDAKFFNKQLDLSTGDRHARNAMRRIWQEQALQFLQGCNIIFVDPDNGLIVPTEENTRKSNKFVLPQELAEYYHIGASVIYYQHKARRPDNFYIAQHRQLIRSGAFPEATGLGLKFTKTSLRYYFFILQPNHTDLVESCVSKMLNSSWNSCFEQII